MKTALISGVSRGLGAALAAGLLRRGYYVVGLGRKSNPDLAQSQTFRFVACDLSQPDSTALIEPLLRELAADEPQQIVLINNAASAAPVGVLGQLLADDINRALQLNLVATTQLANAFCRHCYSLACDKRIINISSGAAFSPISGSSIYCIAKAGLEMLTRTIANETRYHGVTAMSVQPGVIDTEMQAWLRRQPAESLPTVGLYQGFYDRQQLLPAHVVAENIVKSAVLAPPQNGYSFSHDQY